MEHHVKLATDITVAAGNSLIFFDIMSHAVTIMNGIAAFIGMALAVWRWVDYRRGKNKDKH